MKKIIPWLLLLVVFYNCRQKHTVTYNFKVNDTLAVISNEQVNTTIGVLRNRLVKAGYGKPVILYNTGLKQFKITTEQPENDLFIENGLLNNFDLVFYETYSLQDLMPALADEKAKNAFLKYLSPTSESRSAQIGVVKLKDTAAFNKSSTAFKENMPQDCLFLFGKSPIEYNINFVEAFALKDNEHKMTAGNKIISAEGNIDYSGHPAIKIHFNGTGAAQFGKLTANNIGRPVAIVINGKVYSSPFVNGEIEGGDVEISGVFTKQQVNEMANILASGSLPLHLTQIK